MMAETVKKVCFRCNQVVDGVYCVLCGSGQYLGEVDALGSVKVPKRQIESLFRGAISPGIDLIPDYMTIEGFFSDSTSIDEIEAWLHDWPWPPVADCLPEEQEAIVCENVDTEYSKEIQNRMTEKKLHPRRNGRRQ